MVMRPDAAPKTPRPEKLTTSADGYREHASKLKALVRFFEQNSDPGQLDPEAKREARAQHGDTMKSLTNAMDNVPWLQGMNPPEAAAALAEYFSNKANQADDAELAARGVKVLPDTVKVEQRVQVDRPRADGEIVRLPKLGNKDWEVVRIDVSNRKYVIADPNDRRSVSDIVSDVRQNRSRNGAPVGYEVTWEELENLAEQRAA